MYSYEAWENGSYKILVQVLESTRRPDTSKLQGYKTFELINTMDSLFLDYYLWILWDTEQLAPLIDFTDDHGIIRWAPSES